MAKIAPKLTREWQGPVAAAAVRKNGHPSPRLKKLSAAPFSPEGVQARIEVAREAATKGDWSTIRWATSPYVHNIEEELSLNEESFARIASEHQRADLCLLISHLLSDRRSYAAALALIERAIAIYETERDYSAQAEAYYSISYIQLRKSDYHEVERCESRSIELIYRWAMQSETGASKPDRVVLSQAIARARIGLGLLAHRQGQLTRAKAELYTARELLQATATAAPSPSRLYPRTWGDLYATLGRVYSSEGDYETALVELGRALDAYVQAGHFIFATQTRIHIARAYVKQMVFGQGFKASQEKARFHLDVAREELAKRISGGDLRTECLLHLTYSWLLFACEDWAASERLAAEAVRSAKRLGSRYLLAESHRARADAAIQAGKLVPARADLGAAMEYAQGCSNRKITAAVILSLARSYCTEAEPSQVEVDKHLDRFLELKSRTPFESRYLESLYAQIKQDRTELPSERAFYFSGDELLSMGYDAGLQRYQAWAIRFAENNAHGDVKTMGQLLHFRSLGRTYNYINAVRRAHREGLRDGNSKSRPAVRANQENGKQL